MTFCLGMRTHEGLVGIADTRVTSGNEVIQARKLTTYHEEGGCFFLMTSGLRSVRDKAVTYFEDHLAAGDEPLDRLFKAVNGFAQQIRLVAEEDRPSLEKSGFHFDIHCLVGGQMRGDREHKLYLVYPQGNWVEVGKGTPYQIIGAPGYGKPILDRTFHFEDSLQFALRVGVLAFDSTRISAADVNFPVDIVLYRQDTFEMVEHRFDRNELGDISDWWDSRLRQAIQELPTEWMERAWAKLQPKRS